MCVICIHTYISAEDRSKLGGVYDLLKPEQASLLYYSMV